MALSGEVSIDVELECEAEKFWDGLVHLNEIYPRIFPEKYEAIEILEGDGMTVGSIRKLIFAEEIKHIKVMVQKMNVIDYASKTIQYTLIDGDLIKYFKLFRATVKVVAKGDGCVATFTLEYEKVNEEPPSPHVFVEKVKESFMEFSAYLVKN